MAIYVINLSRAAVTRWDDYHMEKSAYVISQICEKKYVWCLCAMHKCWVWRLCGVTFFGQQAHPIHTRWRTQGCEGVTWHVAVTVVWRAPGTNNMLRVRMCGGEKYF